MRERVLTWTTALVVGGAFYVAAATGPIANLGGNTTLRGSVPALSVEIVDADGAQITTLGGGFEGYAEDVAAASGNTVIPMGCIRDDGATTTTADTVGDHTNCLTNATGELVVGAVLRDTSGTALTLASESVTVVPILDSDETEDEYSDVAGCLKGLWAGNQATTKVYVKVFLMDADDVTVGTTVANGGVYQVDTSVSGNLLPAGVCIPYTTGLSIATVTDEATAASTGPDAIVTINAYIQSS